jgi:cytochrome c-type biogenesis protein CcmH
MAVFVAIAAALALAVFAWVLRPLWQVRPLPVFAAIAGLGLAIALLYRAVGTPAALDPAQRELPKTMDEAIVRLEAELQRDAALTGTSQVDGLRLLARAYLQRQQPVKARDAYARALKLAPDDADLLAESAEARALADPQRRFDDAAIEQLQRALRVQPMHQRARWFLGIAQRQRGEHAQAAKTWEPLLAVVDESTATALRPQIDAARSEAGLPPLPAQAAAPADTNSLEVRIVVDPSLAQRMPGSSVFVIARVPGGPPMPVAVEKHPLSSLPQTVTLDDADGPMPTQKLSALQEVDVFARVSQSGDAARQQGDLESEPVRVALPAKGPIELRIP